MNKDPLVGYACAKPDVGAPEDLFQGDLNGVLRNELVAAENGWIDKESPGNRSGSHYGYLGSSKSKRGAPFDFA